MEKKTFYLTEKLWEGMGWVDFTEVGLEPTDTLDDGTLVFEGYWDDTDGDGIPDCLEELAGGDVILTPSGEVVIG